jgi:hypothetical protein
LQPLQPLQDDLQLLQQRERKMSSRQQCERQQLPHDLAAQPHDFSAAQPQPAWLLQPLQPLQDDLQQRSRWQPRSRQQRSRWQHLDAQQPPLSQQLAAAPHEAAAPQVAAALQAGAALQALQLLQPLLHEPQPRWQRALQQRGSQHFLAQPQSAAAPHDFSQQLLLQPQSIPSIRSRSSKPKLWLLRLATTRSAPRIMFRFIEQRLL